MTKTRNLVLGLVGLLMIAACSTTSKTSPSEPPASSAKPSSAKVVLLGDSIAVGESLALEAALKASGVGYQSLAAAGGGNVVGPFSAEGWKKLPAAITAARPTTVVYQITTYDWGTAAEQKAAYRKLLALVTAAGAKLVIVTMPPIKADDFYKPHLADLARTTAVAREVAAESAGKASVLDAAEVWGPAYQQQKDGKADRSTDGIHTCPQGAARFTNWLLGNLATATPGFTPAAADSWANTGWAADKHFKGC
ncbi:SGNH/GDSL hydrolase family protein [Kribbella antibiotica]|uniref:SGNH/GDSL hydrolase family protein n=1 Tax=Kribbella antibiotica TaxID=190195 RepID=A0A4R4ZSX9_9ACTN|nr:SGNH/GDSL hydrolase family protein [Kribbella antibiotica]TDD61386.1 SGNH/GDSL hydrolase family protein [Kribbella antibiotica]